MKLATAQVLNGRVEVPPEIVDGSQVAILVADDEAPFTLSPSEEKDLSAALAEIDAGLYVDGWQLLKELKGRRSYRELYNGL